MTTYLHLRPWLYACAPGAPKSHRGWAATFRATSVAHLALDGSPHDSEADPYADARLRVLIAPIEGTVIHLKGRSHRRTADTGQDFNAPGHLREITDEPALDRFVNTGDTLVHPWPEMRRAIALALVRSGWRVVLDGNEVTP